MSAPQTATLQFSDRSGLMPQRRPTGTTQAREVFRVRRSEFGRYMVELAIGLVYQGSRMF